MTNTLVPDIVAEVKEFLVTVEHKVEAEVSAELALLRKLFAHHTAVTIDATPAPTVVAETSAA